MTPRDLVLSIIGYTLKISPENLRDEQELAELARDSIALFELLINFEKILGRSVKYEEIAQIETVGDIVAYAESLPVQSLNFGAIAGLQFGTK